MKGLHISVAPEAIFHIGPITVTNSLLTSFIVMIILIVIAFNIKPLAKKQSRLTVFFEMIIDVFYNFFKNIAGHRIDTIFPFILTFFLFIIIGNWIGLLPIVGPIGFWHHTEEGSKLIPLFRGPNADLNTTLALTFISVGLTQALSIKALGFKGFIGRFVNIKNPINSIVGVLESISELSKLLSFSFRLFGNIFAGEVLLIVMTFLVPVLVPVPFLILEVFVGFIQALVFTMLTTIFIVIATTAHH